MAKNKPSLHKPVFLKGRSMAMGSKDFPQGRERVGKSSFVYLTCHDKPLTKSSWTIGCNIEVCLHEYKEGTSYQRTYFVELWDVGGNNSHKNARHVFYSSVHGIVLIHDLTNRKSQTNLRRWLAEILIRESESMRVRAPLVDDFDAEQFGGLSQVYGIKKIPIFVVGTRQDQSSHYRISQVRHVSVADELSADEIFVNCLDQRSLAPGSSNAVKLSLFFDKVIEKQLTASRADSSGPHLEKENSFLRRGKSSTFISMT